MEYQYQVVTPIVAEPVTLSEVKNWLRIDADYTSDDATLNMLITSSRELLEKEFNIGFGARTLKLRWNGTPIGLPFGETGTVTSVTKVSDSVVLTADEYHVKGLNFKAIHVGSYGWTNVSWFYPINQGIPEVWEGHICDWEQYDVLYTTGYVTIPKAMINALLVQIDYSYKLQGDETMQPVSPQAKNLLSVYSRNLVIQ